MHTDFTTAPQKNTVFGPKKKDYKLNYVLTSIYKPV